MQKVTHNMALPNQKVMVLPAELAKKALEAYQKSLQHEGFNEIRDSLVEDIQNSATIDGMIVAAQDFITERNAIRAAFTKDYSQFEVPINYQPFQIPIS